MAQRSAIIFHAITRIKQSPLYIKAFSNSIKDGSDYIPVNSYVPENFYKGTDKFLKNPSKNGKWSLGYSNVNLTPVDYAKRAYYMGGYIAPENKFKNLIEEVVAHKIDKVFGSTGHAFD